MSQQEALSKIEKQRDRSRSKSKSPAPEGRGLGASPSLAGYSDRKPSKSRLDILQAEVETQSNYSRLLNNPAGGMDNYNDFNFEN
jgi:hypothetical protein